jgi:ferrous iron transport protein B
VASLSAIAREIGTGWAVFAASWTTFVAYAGATIAYQAGTLSLHPGASVLWLSVMCGLVGLVFAAARSLGKGKLRQALPITPTGNPG